MQYKNSMVKMDGEGGVSNHAVQYGTHVALAANNNNGSIPQMQWKPRCRLLDAIAIPKNRCSLTDDGSS